jgi:hypothetical protein
LKKFFSRPSLLEEISPTERWLPLSLKLALYLWLGFIFVQAATAFAEFHRVEIDLA